MPGDFPRGGAESCASRRAPAARRTTVRGALRAAAPTPRSTPRSIRCTVADVIDRAVGRTGAHRIPPWGLQGKEEAAPARAGERQPRRSTIQRSSRRLLLQSSKKAFDAAVALRPAHERRRRFDAQEAGLRLEVVARVNAGAVPALTRETSGSLRAMRASLAPLSPSLKSGFEQPGVVSEAVSPSGQRPSDALAAKLFSTALESLRSCSAISRAIGSGKTSSVPVFKASITASATAGGGAFS